MCLAYPGRVVSLRKGGRKAVIDYGTEKREVDNTIAKAKVGDWALVQYRMIVAKLSESEAKELLELQEKAFQ